MAQATVKTVQFLDPRIEPQPDPVYDYVIGPTQNQYYKIPASGLSNSSINFNNLTTLGIDRAYLDTFEIELEADITFQNAYFHSVLEYTKGTGGNTNATRKEGAVSTLGDPAVIPTPVSDTHWNTLGAQGQLSIGEVFPTPMSFTFDSFPFNKACDEVRVNINGGAFFSQPMSYARAKERYMDQTRLCRSYQNVCPCIRPMLQTESGRTYRKGDDGIYDDICYQDEQLNLCDGMPSRYPGFFAHEGYTPTPEGGYGSLNNSIIKTGNKTIVDGEGTLNKRYDMFTCSTIQHSARAGTTTYHVKWREPIFCSPFSSRYDATFGRPLYNITSMDIQFTMPTLGNMIRVCSMNPPLIDTSDFPATVPNAQVGAGNLVHLCRQAVSSYEINIRSAKLCYQVMTIPPILNKPLTTLVPYRRFVPYITDYVQSLGTNSTPTNIPAEGAKNVTLVSGVYTLNEIPTAIWIFCAPSKATYQSNNPDSMYTTPAEAVQGTGGNADSPPSTYNHALNSLSWGNYDSNKMFAYLKHLDISMANTTQMLNQAEPEDLYRIAVANGCQDSYWSWSSENIGVYKADYNWPATERPYKGLGIVPDAPWGVGSVIRLRPGVDLIIPDQPLIPGANGNNMVFQVRATFDIPPHGRNQNAYSLWLLFEYVGVAAISPGQCEITMNPLGSGEIMAVSPVMSSTGEETEGTVEGSGHWDKANRAARIAGQLADDGIISMILKRIPGANKAADWAKKHGLGEPSARRGRAETSGGAVLGKGLNAWV